jgi:hypothetical protein
MAKRYTQLPLPDAQAPIESLWLGQHEIQRYSKTFVPDYWYEDPWYLFGVDLFNSKAFWYAHEVWEGKWVFLKKHHPTIAPHFQAFIQVCAMMHKAQQKNQRGVELHFQKIWPKLKMLLPLHHFYGIVLEDWTQEIWMWKHHQTPMPTLTLKKLDESITAV